MNSAYFVAYQSGYKIMRNFIWNNIIWFEKRGSDVIFKMIDNELYTVKNITTTKFKQKFKGGTKDEI